MTIPSFLRSVPLFAAALATLTSDAFAAVPLTDLVDAGTSVSLHLDDMPTLRANWEKSPVGRTWNDSDMRAFFEPLRKKMSEGDFDAKFREATGLSLEEFLNLATGDVLLTIATPYKIEKDGETFTEMPFLTLFEIGDNVAKVEELMEKATEAFVKDGGTESEEDYAGARLRVAMPPEDAAESYRQGFSNPLVWTIHKSILLVGDNKPGLLGALDGIDGKLPAEPLGRSAGYQDVLARDDDAQFTLFFNWQVVYPLVKDDLAAGAAEVADPEQPANPFSLPSIFGALGLDVFETMYFSGRIGDTETVSNAGVTYRSETGIVKLLAYRDGPVAQPDWVPANWFNVTSANFSIRDVYAGIETLLDTLNPMVAGMVQGKITGLNRQLNLDLKRDLIGNFGENFISGYSIPAAVPAGEVPPMEELDQFFAISLADAAGFERTIESLKAMAGPGLAQVLLERDYLGRKLFTFTPPVPGARGFSYAIVDRWLMVGIGSPASVESVLQTLDSGKAGGYWQREDVRAALADVPPGAFTVQHQDLPKLLASIVATLCKQQSTVAEEDRFINPDAKPTLEQISRHWADSISYGERDGRGLHVRGILKHPQP